MTTPSADARRAKQYTIPNLTPSLSTPILSTPNLSAPFSSPILPNPVLAAAVLVLAAAGVRAAEPPATRSVAVKVVDRMGRPVKDAAACLLPA